jgi:hypothetical protein
MTTIPTDVDTDTFNFTDLLKQPFIHPVTINSVTFGTTNSPILDLLNAIHVTYNLLEESNFANFKNKINGLTINKYSLVSNGSSVVYETVTGIQQITEIVQKIIPNVATLDTFTSNIPAIQSLLLGYSLMIHLYIALFIRTSDYDNTFVDLLLGKFQAINNAMFSNSTGILGLQLKITDNITKYNIDTQRISQQNQEISKETDRANLASNTVTKNSSLLTKTYTIYYIYLILFIIFVAIIGYILTTTNSNVNLGYLSKLISDGMLQIIAAIIFAVSCVSLLIISYVNKKIFEGFDDLVISPASSPVMLPFSVYSESFSQEFIKYLENAINIALLKDTNMRYVDVTSSLDQKVKNNDITEVQLKLKTETLTDTQVEKYRKSQILKYQVYLFLQILILLSAATLIHLYSSASFDSLLIIITILLLTFAIYNYIIQTERLVHTDSTKVYWTKPSV